jgi:hypothetical protein
LPQQMRHKRAGLEVGNPTRKPGAGSIGLVRGPHRDTPGNRPFQPESAESSCGNDLAATDFRRIAQNKSTRRSLTRRAELPRARVVSMADLSADPLARRD